MCYSLQIGEATAAIAGVCGRDMGGLVRVASPLRHAAGTDVRLPAGNPATSLAERALLLIATGGGVFRFMQCMLPVGPKCAPATDLEINIVWVQRKVLFASSLLREFCASAVKGSFRWRDFAIDSVAKQV